jgi:Raf kinase inhibitor-like YbhB/YbcL family protein
VRQAFVLLGVMTLIVSIGAFFAFQKSAHAPEDLAIEGIQSSMSLTLTSPVFEHEGVIPSVYTCDADNISMPLRIENVPEGTKSLVLVMDDPDIPESVKQARGIEKFDHWVVYNIPPDTTEIGAGEVVGTLGLNLRGETAYAGPCPPDREHRYFFRLYALTGTLQFITTPTLRDVEEAAKGMMIEQTTLMGRYERTHIEGN